MIPAPALEELGLCPFAQITGKPCVLCGGTRAILGLAKGDIDNAIASNAFVAIVVPALVVTVLAHTTWLTLVGHNMTLESLRKIRLNNGLKVLLGMLTIGWIWNLARW